MLQSCLALEFVEVRLLPVWKSRVARTSCYTTRSLTCGHRLDKLGRRLVGFQLLLFCVLTPSLARCQAIRDLSGFRAHTLPRNDDGSSPAVSIGFDVDFFGRTYQNLYVNNNGNVTFQGPLATYVPFSLDRTNIPIIAAFFADIDTRGYRSQAVTYGTDVVDGRRALGVDFFSVGYYDTGDDRLNTFQLILIERSDTGPGNFDIEFNYAQIQWDTTRSVSAVAGFSNGTAQADALYQLPGSMERGAFLDNGYKSLAYHRLNSPVTGRYVFHARAGRVSVLQITPIQLPEGMVGRPYSSPPLQATGGVPPYIWSSVNWPSDLGLRLNPDTGEITGTPNRSGDYQLTVQVADRAGTAPARHTFSLSVKGLPPTPTPTPRMTPTPSPSAPIPSPTPSPTPLTAITTYLIQPRQATVNHPVIMVAGLRIANSNALPRQLEVQAHFSGQDVILHDDGLDGDEVAGDGRYSGRVIFGQAGNIPVTIQVKSGSVRVSAEDQVKVWGSVTGVGPLDLNLGKLKAGGESCKPLVLGGEQQGEVPFELRLLQSLPLGYKLSLRTDKLSYDPGSPALSLRPAESKQICLQTGRRAPSSHADGQPWIELMVQTEEGQKDLAAVNLRWEVESLSLWERWGWLVLSVTAVLFVIFIIYGYIRPYRFPRELAVTFVPDYEDLDTSPQPLSQWRGVGIGFYRDAKAFLHPDFRISGKPKGALGMLKATGQGIWVAPVGSSLHRQVELSEWEEIQIPGRQARAALVYRFSERGPFFRLSSSARRRSAP